MEDKVKAEARELPTNEGCIDTTRDSRVIKNTASGARLLRFKTKFYYLLAVLSSGKLII